METDPFTAKLRQVLNILLLRVTLQRVLTVYCPTRKTTKGKIENKEVNKEMHEKGNTQLKKVTIKREIRQKGN